MTPSSSDMVPLPYSLVDRRKAAWEPIFKAVPVDDKEALEAAPAATCEPSEASSVEDSSEADATHDSEQGSESREFFLGDDDNASMLVSPNGMFKSRSILRLWRSQRVRLLNGQDIVVCDETGNQIWSSPMTTASQTSIHDDLRVGDVIVSPNRLFKLKFLSDLDVAVFDVEENEVWSEQGKRRRPSEGWRGLPSKVKKHLLKQGIDNPMWTAFLKEEDAPTSLKDLVAYAFKRRDELKQK